MCNKYEPRALVKTLRPDNGELEHVECGQSELTDVLREAIAAARTVVAVEPLESLAEEEEHERAWQEELSERAARGELLETF